MQSRKNDRELRMEHFLGKLTDAYPNLRRLSRKGNAKALLRPTALIACGVSGRKTGLSPILPPNLPPK